MSLAPHVSPFVSLMSFLVGEGEISCLVPGCKLKNRIKGNKHVELEDCMSVLIGLI